MALSACAKPASSISIKTPGTSSASGTDTIRRPATSSSMLGSARNARTMRAPKFPAPPTTTTRILGSPLSSIQKQSRESFNAQLCYRLIARFPRLTVEFRHEPRPDAIECLNGVRFAIAHSRGQQWRDIFDEAGRQLLQHALLCHSSGDLLAFQFQVMMEARDKLVVIDCELFEGVVQVEHVAILTALQKRA